MRSKPTGRAEPQPARRSTTAGTGTIAGADGVVRPITVEPGATSGVGRVLRIRLDLSYDGTAFSGWASQPGLRTVQQCVQDCLAVLFRADPATVRVTVAGRTDAGVHARGQVAHVDVLERKWLSVGEPVRALAGLLPPDLRVRAATVAPAGFDARFSALWRRYSYRVCDDPGGPDPLSRHYVLWHRRAPLDESLLNAASAALLGLHDFAAFCRARPAASTVRTLLDLSWSRCSDGVLEATVTADAFCHSMVRSLLGALIPVGTGRAPVHWPAALLARAERDPAVHVLPARGLTLEEVRYPPADEMGARVLVTRRPRPGFSPPR